MEQVKQFGISAFCLSIDCRMQRIFYILDHLATRAEPFPRRADARALQFVSTIKWDISKS